MGFKTFTEILSEIWFHTQCLQQENTHPYYALLRRIELIFNGVENNYDKEVMRSACIDDERPETLIALSNFPEKHNHFRGTFRGLLCSWNIGSACVEGLIKNPCHSIHNELEILWSVQTPKEVSKVIFGYVSRNRT